MNKLKVYQALESLVTSTVYEKVKDSVITKEGNSYKLFESYIIKKQDIEFSIEKVNYHGKLLLSSLKHSVTWVVLDRMNDIMGTKQLVELDQRLTGLEINIKIYEKLLKKTKDTGNNLLFQAKLTEEKRKRVRVINELEVLAEKSKKWQLRQFEKSSYK
jgi:hypothetical protein